jgi:PTS system glucitol/sorbitol-specific IIA component
MKVSICFGKKEWTMIKYQGKVLAIGPLVDEFIQAGILVFFGKDAPEELIEFSVIHDATKLTAPIEPGDMVYLGKEDYKILAVGEVANTNLANLGHLILKFNGEEKARLPGDVNLELKPIPEIKVGMEIKIEED